MRSLKQVPIYYKGLRLEIHPFLPESAQRILDVGCGAGAFGHHLKSEFGCEAWGIEIVPEMAELARERLDRVDCGDCMQILPSYPEASFDLITFTDVLEHLAWPDQALEHAKRLLTPNGVVVASVPNLRYWPALKRLVFEGDFPQEDSGTFDRTHLRFFTQSSAQRLFESNGWEVVKMEGVNAYVSFWMRAANVLAMRKLKDLKFLQYVVVARPRSG